MGPLPPAKRTNAFGQAVGMSAPLSPEFEQSDYEMNTPPSPESEEDEPETRQDFCIKQTLFPSPVPKQNVGIRARTPLFLPSPSSPSPTLPMQNFGIRTGLSPSPPSPTLPMQNFGIRTGSPPSPPSPPVQKQDFGIRTGRPPPLPSPPVQKRDFGIRTGRPPSLPSPPVQKRDFGIRTGRPLPRPSLQVQKRDFGIRLGMPLSLPPPPPPTLPKQNFGIRTYVPSDPSPVPKKDFGIRTALKTRAPRAVSPLPHAEDSGVSVVEEEPPQTSDHQSTEANEPSGSSSKAHPWKWGEPAPSSPIGEVESADSDESTAPDSHGFTIRAQATLLREIHSRLAYIFASERRLSTVLDEMLEELEDADVQALM